MRIVLVGINAVAEQVIFPIVVYAYTNIGVLDCLVIAAVVVCG
jgi:hypothetical protein